MIRTESNCCAVMRMIGKRVESSCLAGEKTDGRLADWAATSNPDLAVELRSP